MGIIPGKEKNTIVDVLTTRTKAQRHAVSEEYLKQEKEVGKHIFKLRIFVVKLLTYKSL